MWTKKVVRFGVIINLVFTPNYINVTCLILHAWPLGFQWLCHRACVWLDVEVMEGDGHIFNDVWMRVMRERERWTPKQFFVPAWSKKSPSTYPSLTLNQTHFGAGNQWCWVVDDDEPTPLSEHCPPWIGSSLFWRHCLLPLIRLRSPLLQIPNQLQRWLCRGGFQGSVVTAGRKMGHQTVRPVIELLNLSYYNRSNF